MSDLAWILLIAISIVALVVDLLWSRRSDAQQLKHAVAATVIWTLVGLGFTGVVLAVTDAPTAGRYVTVFTLEKSLSLDNVAVFASVMSALAVAPEHRPRVLTGGLLGALALRIVMIIAGLALVSALHDVLIGFGVLLIVAGGRMLWKRDHGGDSGGPPPLLERFSPAALRRHPEMLALVAVLFADVAFAGDSILAAFGITTEAYPVIAANVFAVLGLRPLYVVLEHAVERFRYLPQGIGVLLAAIGLELVLGPVVTVPEWATLVGIVVILAVAVGCSVAADHGMAPRRLGRRVAVTAGGGALLVAGVAMLVLPGPGLVVIAAGLALLATEYTWAKRALAAVRTKLRQARDKVRR